MLQKSLPIIAFAFSLFTTAHAQINKGAVLTGTSIGYSQSKGNISSSDLKSKSFAVSPAVGIAIKENLVAGIRFDYLKNTQKNVYGSNNTYDDEAKNYGGSLFIRRYVPLISRLYVFGEGSASYTNARETNTQAYYTSTNERKIKGWSTGLHITPGISYGVCKKFLVEFGYNSLLNASYGKIKSTYNNTPEEKQESFSGGISKDNNSMFFIAFQIIL
ncbi:hypothetical protein A3860_19700 [Niastella vici]|uniref:Outer membrane protein beta-barrel domain-containing protein n=1 Tax=Niastella vici TaxID=1703345 RepID=A0A1V9G333_9BACT|nr:hypothetical protein [Niastella vici]OQP64974.1 hypothetical protein A3860_19700 [Niastella vici]